MPFSLPKNSQGIPLLGVGSGTFYFKGPSSTAPVNPQLVSIFSSAIKAGFVHLDSAECYGNDAELKQTMSDILSQTDIKREDIFITDKFFVGDGSYSFRSKEANPYERIKNLTKELNTPYVDLYLIHAPFIKKETHGYDLKEAWKFMQQAYDEGLAKRIGVSNFAVGDIEEIWNTTKVNPQVNQIEYNAFLQNQTPGIVEFCQSKDIVVEAYSPLAPLTGANISTGPGLKFIEYIDTIGEKYSKTRLQILLRWVIQRGVVPITTTSKVERFEEFKGVFDWELDPSEVSKITQLGLDYKPMYRKYWKPEYTKFD